MKKPTFTRRGALGSALAATGAGLPWLGACRSAGAVSDGVRIAHIGVSGAGADALRVFEKENQVALCDVDERRAAKFRKRHAKAPFFKDYRRMLDKMGGDIDAVVVSTPNHTHFSAAMEAIERGKHVLIEMPLAHSVWEVQTLKKAAAYHGVVVQMYNPTADRSGFRNLKAWYDAGLCGEVKEVVAWFSGLPDPGKPDWFALAHHPPTRTPVPVELDWDLWLGSAGFQEYSEEIVAGWRAWWAFGSGVLGDMGCRALDVPTRLLGLGSPSSITAEESRYHEEIIADTSKVVYRFPGTPKGPPVRMTWYNGRIPDELAAYARRGVYAPRSSGILLVGDKQTMYVNLFGRHPRILMPPDEWLEMQDTLPQVNDSEKDSMADGKWLDRIRSGDRTPDPKLDHAARISENVLLGVLAQRTGKPIEWDGTRIVNDSSLEKYIHPPARKGWEYGASYWK